MYRLLVPLALLLVSLALPAGEVPPILLQARLSSAERLAAIIAEGPYGEMLAHPGMATYLTGVGRVMGAAAAKAPLEERDRATLPGSLGFLVVPALEGPGITIAAGVHSGRLTDPLWRTLCGFVKADPAKPIIRAGIERIRLGEEGLSFGWGGLPPELPPALKPAAGDLPPTKPGIAGTAATSACLGWVVHPLLGSLLEELGCGEARFSVPFPEGVSRVQVAATLADPPPPLDPEQVDWSFFTAGRTPPLADAILALTPGQQERLNRALAALMGLPVDTVQVRAPAPGRLYLQVLPGVHAPEVIVAFPALPEIRKGVTAAKVDYDVDQALARGLPLSVDSSVGCLPQVLHVTLPESKRPYWLVGTAPLTMHRLALGLPGTGDAAAVKRAFSAKLAKTSVGIVHVATTPLVQEIADMFAGSVSTMPEMIQGCYKAVIEKAPGFKGEDAWATVAWRGGSYDANVLNGISGALVPMLLLNKSLQGHQEAQLVAKRQECLGNMRFILGWLLDDWEKKGTWPKDVAEARKLFPFVAPHVWVCHTNPAVTDPYIFLKPKDKVPTAKVPIVIQRLTCNYGQGVLVVFADGSHEYVPGKDFHDLVVATQKRAPDGVALHHWPEWMQGIITSDLSRPDSRGDMNRLVKALQTWWMEHDALPPTLEAMFPEKDGPGDLVVNSYNPGEGPHYVYLPPADLEANPKQPVLVENPANNGGKGGLVGMINRFQHGLIWIEGDLVWKHALTLKAQGKQAYTMEDWAPAVREMNRQKGKPQR